MVHGLYQAVNPILSNWLLIHTNTATLAKAMSRCIYPLTAALVIFMHKPFSRRGPGPAMLISQGCCGSLPRDSRLSLTCNYAVCLAKYSAANPSQRHPQPLHTAAFKLYTATPQTGSRRSNYIHNGVHRWKDTEPAGITEGC